MAHRVATIRRPDLQWQTVSGLRNGTTYEVQVASVNRVGTGAYISKEGTPVAPKADQPPPEPEGEEPFNVGTLNVWWTGVDPEGNQWGNLTGRWTPAPGHIPSRSSGAAPGVTGTRQEWAAHIALSGDASRGELHLPEIRHPGRLLRDERHGQDGRPGPHVHPRAGPLRYKLGQVVADVGTLLL